MKQEVTVFGVWCIGVVFPPFSKFPQQNIFRVSVTRTRSRLLEQPLNSVLGAMATDLYFVGEEDFCKTGTDSLWSLHYSRTLTLRCSHTVMAHLHCIQRSLW